MHELNLEKVLLFDKENNVICQEIRLRKKKESFLFYFVIIIVR